MINYADAKLISSAWRREANYGWEKEEDVARSRGQANIKRWTTTETESICDVNS
jgi:hypothetical protein